MALPLSSATSLVAHAALTFRPEVDARKKMPRLPWGHGGLVGDASFGISEQRFQCGGIGRLGHLYAPAQAPAPEVRSARASSIFPAPWWRNRPAPSPYCPKGPP